MPRRKLSPQSIWDVEAVRSHMSEHNVKPVHLRNVWKYAFTAETLDEVCQKLLQEKSPPPSRWLKALCRDFSLCTSTVTEFRTKNASSGCTFVVQTQDSLIMEAVVMKASDSHDSNKSSKRITLCISSQVGCKMGCTFCETGTLGHLGNLTAGEIVEQLYHATKWVSNGSLGATKVRNIVFMGMGEPLDNYPAVVGAVEAMQCDLSFGILGRHITVSTVGVLSRISQLAVDPIMSQVNLAVSLHAATQETRLIIVPSAKGSPLDKLVQSMFDYCKKANRGIMIEYIVLAGLNDSEKDAQKLAELLDGLNCWVNLIPYNPTSIGESNGFRSPSNEALRSLEQNIRRCGSKNHTGEPISIRTRFSTQSGQDAESACGQLAAAATLKLAKSRNKNACDIEDLQRDPLHQPLKAQERLSRSPFLARYRFEAIASAGIAVSLLCLYRWQKCSR